MQNRLTAWFDTEELVEVLDFTPEVAAMIDAGDIRAGEAMILAKIPKEKQLFWAKQAKSVKRCYDTIREIQQAMWEEANEQTSDSNGAVGGQ